MAHVVETRPHERPVPMKDRIFSTYNTITPQVINNNGFDPFLLEYEVFFVCLMCDPSYCFNKMLYLPVLNGDLVPILLASCQISKIVRCACTGHAGNVFPATAG